MSEMLSGKTRLMATLGTAEAKPGSVDIGRLFVGETRDGTPLGLPVCMINGASEGRTLYIQAASDGDELNGVEVVRKLVPRLDPAEIAGTIFIVGIVNIHAFQTSTHRNPIDDRKLNRTYPGDKNGSSSEQLAAATFKIVKEVDYALDLHQGSTSQMVNEARIRCGRHHRLHTECIELAKAFNCKYILDQKGPPGQLAQAAPSEGIPTIDPELGGSVGTDPKSTKIGIRGIENVLKYYNFLDEKESKQQQISATNFQHYIASAGGLIEFKNELGDNINRGDLIYTITDVFGSIISKEFANKSGIFWRACRLPQVATGEYVCSIGININRR